MQLEKELQNELFSRGVDFIRFVDISGVPPQLNKNFPSAILIGMTLSKEYLGEIIRNPNYVEEKVKTRIIQNDEFESKEKQTDALADFTSGFLISKGYSTYSQSEKNIEKTGFYDAKNKQTPLPHKTIALLAGLGWIGKHDMLVTPEFGSAVSMCTVLTDAPLETVSHALPKSLCGNCKVCVDVCTDGALKGKNWEQGIVREEIIDVSKCTTCLRCMIFCPFTRKYLIGKTSVL